MSAPLTRDWNAVHDPGLCEHPTASPRAEHASARARSTPAGSALVRGPESDAENASPALALLDRGLGVTGLGVQAHEVQSEARARRRARLLAADAIEGLEDLLALRGRHA